MMWTTRPRSRIGDVSAIVAGDGPLVVLVHGVGLRAEAWNRQIDVLATRHRVLAVDLPGHGDSPVLNHQMGLSGYTEAIVGSLDEPALVVGHSMGAMVALDMVSRYPDHVHGIAALNAIHQRSSQAQLAVHARAAELDGECRIDPSRTLERWFANQESAERSACQKWLTQMDPRAYRMAYQVFANENGPSDQVLSAISCPAMFVTGSEEPNSTPAMSHRMADLAPHGHAKVLNGAAHMMPMTHADEVSALLLGLSREVCK
jgi:(E)-2-((N-methylformamido)methylene)succinate hydrolase